MKVIHLISGGDSGGAKTHVLSLLQHLNQTHPLPSWCASGTVPSPRRPGRWGIPTMICGGNNVLRVRRQADRLYPPGRL